MNIFVIPAKAGISGRYVAALLHETPTFAGVTRWCETPAFAGATV
jgi:hypothetical protein